MALLRLSNGGDVRIKLEIAEALAMLAAAADGDAFVELPGDEGPIHVRRSGVIAILDTSDRKTTGFRLAQ